MRKKVERNSAASSEVIFRIVLPKGAMKKQKSRNLKNNNNNRKNVYNRSSVTYLH